RFLLLTSTTALALLTLSATGSSSAPAATTLLPAGAVAPTVRQRQLAPRIAATLEEMHYRQLPIDDKFSSQVLDRYLDELDGQHSYFTAADVQSFERWRTKFDDMIHTGQVDPAFLIYSRLQQSNRDRIHYALQLLATEPDWKREESFDYDRTKAAWPRDVKELNEIWRQRVKNDALSLMLTGKSWAEASALLQKRYQRVLARIEQVSSDDVFETLMNAYAAVYDPHSSFFSPRNSEEYKINMSLSYEGIGASLRLDDDYVTITDLLAGGAAAAAGTLKINDRVTAVGQGTDGEMVDVIGWRLDDVVEKIRGKGGTTVRLQLLPAGAAPGTPEKIISLVRGKIKLENRAAKKEVRTIERDGRMLKVGIITVPGFYQDIDANRSGDRDYRSTTRDVLRLLKEMRDAGGIDALLLDLRGDGGGYLPEATALTGLFIDQGPVVQLKYSNGRIEVLDDPASGTAYDGPLTVLVDRTSASASEIFAGAIQDYRRGLILGQTTFGKGSVQNLIPLDRFADQPVDGQITVTIGKFYRVTGASTQLRGVQPDIPLPSAISTKDVGESSLDFAMPWDTVPAASFKPLDFDSSIIKSLAEREAARDARNPDALWYQQALSELEAARDKTSVSLNLEQRKRERTEQDAQRLREENARLVADGKPAIKSLEDEVPADQPDVVLAEAADITADSVVIAPTQNLATQASSAR
ncbi:MAG TPA: carboxy terminal-processing peptidase, partial [Steroidobacteraceae bacterium]|nr:carboxy terminal-processing peptidase [Steroidobacteraceae bacterium]